MFGIIALLALVSPSAPAGAQAPATGSTPPAAPAIVPPAEIPRQAGLDRATMARILARIPGDATARDAQRHDELIARGGFGSPTMFVDGDDMYFGNDRLSLVLDALARARG